MKPYKISICLLIKDENRYLEEWLQWHADVCQVDHFFIYDNNSIIPIRDSIPPRYKDMCTVIDYPTYEHNLQPEVYKHCVDTFASTSEWIAFIDTDEFIRVVDGRPLYEFLQQYQIVDALECKWIVYGANGKIEDSNLPQRERFTKRGQFPTHHPQCKSIVHMTGKKFTQCAHGPIATHVPLTRVDENFQTVCSGDGTLPEEKIVIDHYFTRSYEEWLDGKMKRGSCDSGYERKMHWFLTVNPEMKDAVKQYHLEHPELPPFSAAPQTIC